jgi:hypothetical protein
MVEASRRHPERRLAQSLARGQEAGAGVLADLEGQAVVGLAPDGGTGRAEQIEARGAVGREVERVIVGHRAAPFARGVAGWTR